MRITDRSVGVWSNNIGSQINVGIASANEGAYFAWSDSRNGNSQTQAEDTHPAALKLDPSALISSNGDDGVPSSAHLGAGLALGLGMTMTLV